MQPDYVSQDGSGVAAMIAVTCQNCGEEFQVKPYRKGTARFCSKSCNARFHVGRLNTGSKPYMRGNKLRAGLKPTNGFEAGSKPWNAGVKGIHLSPETEFQKGRESDRKMPLGTVTTRLDKNGKPRAFIKTGEPNTWAMRAVHVWEQANGPVPSGHIVHHKDRDTLNDDIGNLELMSRAEHIEEHRQELLAAKFPPQAPSETQSTLFEESA